MKQVLVNLVIIISGVVGWTFYSLTSDEMASLEGEIYLVEHGGVDIASGGKQVLGIEQLNQIQDKAMSLSSYHVNNVRNSTVRLAQVGIKVFEAYSVNGQIYTIGKGSSLEDLPVELNVPELGLSSVEVAGKVSSVRMVDVLDSTGSVLKKMPELYLKKLEFDQNGIFISGLIVGE